jgi:hypothetical protein
MYLPTSYFIDGGGLHAQPLATPLAQTGSTKILP